MHPLIMGELHECGGRALSAVQYSSVQHRAICCMIDHTLRIDECSGRVSAAKYAEACKRSACRTAAAYASL